MYVEVCVCVCVDTWGHCAHAHNETKNFNTNRCFYNTHTARETKTERETFAASKFGCFEFSPKRHVWQTYFTMQGLPWNSQEH